MAQYKSYTHVLRIDKDEVQGILCGDVVVMPKLDGTNACLFMKDGTVHAGSRTSKTFYAELLKSSALTKIAPALPRCL